MRVFKCLNCQSDAVDEIIDKDKMLYKCYTCGQVLPQAYTMDSRLKFGLTRHKEPYHFMVALVVKNQDGKVLLLNRRVYPFAWSLVAGHIHYGETPRQAAQRELVEETGLYRDRFKRLFTTTNNNACDAGVEQHKMYVFEVAAPPDSQIVVNSEAQEFRWVNLTKKSLDQFQPMSGKADAILARLTS